MTKTIIFVRERETKNTVRFQEPLDGEKRPVIGTLYVLKSVAGSARGLRVTLETVDGPTVAPGATVEQSDPVTALVG